MLSHLSVSWVAVLVLTSLCGCGSLGNINSQDDLELGATESIIVIRIPEAHRLSLRSGQLLDSRWKAGSAVVSFRHKPDQGYIVVKLTAEHEDNVIGVHRLQGLGAERKEFRVCHGRETLVFEVPPRQVLYFGDLSFTQLNDLTELKINNNISVARQYLRIHYPGMAEKLSSADFTFLPSHRSGCNASAGDILNSFLGSLTSGSR